MTLDNTLMSMEENVRNAESVKSTVINAMIREKIVSDEDGKRFNITHYVAILKNGWFKKLCLFLKLDEEPYIYRVVRLMSDEEYDENKENEENE